MDKKRKAGHLRDITEVYAGLGEIVAGKNPRRESDEERIISMNLELAIEDMATAIMIYEKAEKKGVGVWLPL